MALPASTIIFGLATTAVFGLAVRDTIKNPKPNPYADLEDRMGDRYEPPEIDEEAYRQRMAEYEAEAEERRREQQKLDRERAKMREEAEAEAEAQLAKDKVRDVRELSKLFGTTRASFGGVLAGLKLGAPSAEAKPKLEALSKVTEGTHAMESTVDEEGDVLRSLTIQPQLGCDDLHDAVAALWGSGARGGGRTVWSEDKTSMRVVLEKSSDRNCSFQFEQYAPLDRFLSKAPSSTMPFAFIGKSDVELLTEVKRRPTAYGVNSSDFSISWTDIGAAGGRSTTTFAATVEKKKVVRITASVDVISGEDITARLDALFGTHEEVDGTPTWSKPYPISWDGTTLSAGKKDE